MQVEWMSGEPICLDKATEERRRIDFAKVCVEVHCYDELPESIDVEVEGGEFFEVNIEYPCNHKGVHLERSRVIMLSSVQRQLKHMLLRSLQ